MLVLLKENPATQLFWKIDIICRQHLQIIAGVSESYGLYPGQSRILHTISEMSGSTQKEIAERLDISPASMAVSIKRLQKAGLVEKAADQKDLRHNRISVTEKGRRLLMETLSDFIRYDNRLLEGFGPEEMRQLDLFLTKLQSNLKEAKLLNAESRTQK